MKCKVYMSSYCLLVLTYFNRAFFDKLFPGGRGGGGGVGFRTHSGIPATNVLE